MGIEGIDNLGEQLEPPVLPANPPEFRLEQLANPTERNVFDNDAVRLPGQRNPSNERTENPYCHCGKHLGLQFHESGEHFRAMAREKVQTNPPLEHHDSNTLGKVFDALRETGLKETTVMNCITAMQNAGILFRERR